MRVYIVPVVEKGFIPISEDNRVFFILEDEEGHSPVKGRVFQFDTIELAETWCDERGYDYV